MRARLALAFLVLVSCSRGSRHPPRAFNITAFSVPPVVHVGQAEVHIECHYTGNFTMLQIFKGTGEIFRFKPNVWPAIRSYPTPGIGAISIDQCGSTSCHIQLNNITELAAGLYRCDIEHDSPPYLYTTRSANMTVEPAPRRMPFIDGFAEEYGEGDEMLAVCRIEPGSIIKWYVNGEIDMPLYGLRTFRYRSTRSLFLGEPPVVKLQCVEERGFITVGSKIVLARWVERHAPTNGSANNGEAGTVKISVNDCTSISSVNYVYKYLLYSFSLTLANFQPHYLCN